MTIVGDVVMVGGGGGMVVVEEGRVTVVVLCGTSVAVVGTAGEISSHAI